MLRTVTINEKNTPRIKVKSNNLQKKTQSAGHYPRFRYSHPSIYNVKLGYHTPLTTFCNYKLKLCVDVNTAQRARIRHKSNGDIEINLIAKNRPCGGELRKQCGDIFFHSTRMISPGPSSRPSLLSLWSQLLGAVKVQKVQKIAAIRMQTLNKTLYNYDIFDKNVTEPHCFN